MQAARRLLVAVSFALLLLPLIAPTRANALPITPTFNWRASATGTNPAQWNATIGTQQWALSGTTLTTPATSRPAITRAVSFGAGSTANGISFDSIASGDPSNESASFELWFRPTNLTGGQQVLFETGGNGDGLSILLNNNQLLFRVKDSGTVRTITTSLGVSAADFFQVAITLSLNSTAQIYVNGILAASGSTVGINDWSNANGAGLSSRNGQLGGNSGNDINGYGDFRGEIAIMRFYRNQVLTAGQVLQNYNAVAVPEPGTVVLVAIGLIGLGVAPSRLRAR